ncbi:uncharacterized protein LOC126896246 isoform X2 [Daktulosphaira vitifoliae]|uniref:uncharacterized protein LOC126896246 isoform X2 n=1 Tax=Daktulosphaira vitifoliae TaxID=58002 RepID=UPI0021AA5D07|nr:uncharacterized protein LOC126896246 isoform X2 [Daktulosphaira vitifoliae]
MASIKYSKGEKILCNWRKVWYEARILDIRHEIDGVQYYHVHYYKFTKKWNETVSEHRLMPHTSANVKIMKQSKKDAKKIARDMKKAKINGRPYIKENNKEKSDDNFNKHHNKVNVALIQDKNLATVNETISNTSKVKSPNHGSVKDMQKYHLKDAVVKIPKVALPLCFNNVDFRDSKNQSLIKNNKLDVVENIFNCKSQEVNFTNSIKNKNNTSVTENNDEILVRATYIQKTPTLIEEHSEEYHNINTINEINDSFKIDADKNSTVCNGDQSSQRLISEITFIDPMIEKIQKFHKNGIIKNHIHQEPNMCDLNNILLMSQSENRTLKSDHNILGPPVCVKVTSTQNDIDLKEDKEESSTSSFEDSVGSFSNQNPEDSIKKDYIFNENYPSSSNSFNKSSKFQDNLQFIDIKKSPGNYSSDSKIFITSKKTSLKNEPDIFNSELKFNKKLSSLRGAAIKAASAITMMSKSGSRYEKKKDVGKQTKNNQKLNSDEDDLSDSDNAELKDYGLDFPNHCVKIYIEDYHLLEDDRYILNLPAKFSVYMILCDYARKFPVCLDTLNIMLDAFNQGLGVWCLHRIEKLQYQQVIEKYPNLTVSHIYGLPHLIRFILCLPKLFRLMENDCKEFVPNVKHFVRGLLIYLVDENLCINVERDYQPVMPDYFRMTYY